MRCVDGMRCVRCSANIAVEVNTTRLRMAVAIAFKASKTSILQWQQQAHSTWYLHSNSDHIHIRCLSLFRPAHLFVFPPFHLTHTHTYSVSVSCINTCYDYVFNLLCIIFYNFLFNELRVEDNQSHLLRMERFASAKIFNMTMLEWLGVCVYGTLYGANENRLPLIVYGGQKGWKFS